MSRPDDLLICPACGRARQFLINGRCGECLPAHADYYLDAAQRQPSSDTAPHGTASTQRPDSTANTPSTTAENTTHHHAHAATANTTVTTEPITDLTSSTRWSVPPSVIAEARANLAAYGMARDAGVPDDVALHDLISRYA